VSAAEDEDFSAYVAARWSALVREAIYLGCSPTEAEDLVQATLIHCYRSWARVRRADRIDAYVHKVLVTTNAKARRRRWHGEVPTEQFPEEVGDNRMSMSDARADLRRVLSGLSLDHRTVLVLRFVTDLTEQQTADVLGVPLGTVKSRMSRALAAIDPVDLLEQIP
jgi:RNA polymerase sigma-70 factor (sigma-E family)